MACLIITKLNEGRGARASLQHRCGTVALLLILWLTAHRVGFVLKAGTSADLESSGTLWAKSCPLCFWLLGFCLEWQKNQMNGYGPELEVFICFGTIIFFALWNECPKGKYLLLPSMTNVHWELETGRWNIGTCWSNGSSRNLWQLLISTIMTPSIVSGENELQATWWAKNLPVSKWQSWIVHAETDTTFKWFQLTNAMETEKGPFSRRLQLRRKRIFIREGLDKEKWIILICHISSLDSLLGPEE